jgi:hypothetical protein
VSLLSAMVLTIPCRPPSDAAGAKPRRQSLLDRMADAIPHTQKEDNSIPGLQSNKLGLDWSSAVGLIAVGTMLYVTWTNRNR